MGKNRQRRKDRGNDILDISKIPLKQHQANVKLSATLPEKNWERTGSVFTNHSLEYSPSYCKFESYSTSDWLNRLLSQSDVMSLSGASKYRKTRPRTLSMMFGIEVLRWY